MENKSRFGCIIAVIISIIIGVIIGVLFANGLLVGAIRFIKIALIMSGISMAILLGVLYASNDRTQTCIFNRCICDHNVCLLTTSIGTLVFGTLSATIGLMTTVTISILMLAFTAFFFSWLIASIIMLVSHIIRLTRRENE